MTFFSGGVLDSLAHMLIEVFSHFLRLQEEYKMDFFVKYIKVRNRIHPHVFRVAKIRYFYLRPKATQMYEHRCPSGRLSVCLSDCPDFLTTFPMSDYHEIGREGVSWKK